MKNSLYFYPVSWLNIFYYWLYYVIKLYFYASQTFSLICHFTASFCQLCCCQGPRKRAIVSWRCLIGRDRQSLLYLRIAADDIIHPTSHEVLRQERMKDLKVPDQRAGVFVCILYTKLRIGKLYPPVMCVVPRNIWTNFVSVLSIRIAFEAFTADVTETKIFWLVSTVSGGQTASFLRLTGLNFCFEPWN